MITMSYIMQFNLKARSWAHQYRRHKKWEETTNTCWK